MEENLIYKKSRQILIEQCSILDATIQQLEQELYNFDNQGVYVTCTVYGCYNII